MFALNVGFLLFSVQSPTSSLAQRVFVLLLLCCVPQSCHPQLLLPFSSGVTYHPPFQSVTLPSPALADLPKAQDAVPYDIEVFFGDQFYVCQKQPQSPAFLHAIVSAIHMLEPFYPYKSICTGRFHPFYLMRVPAKKSLIGLTESYVVVQEATTDVVLQKNNIESIPSRYFCKLRNATNLEIHGNVIDSSASLGFSQQCSSDCNPTLKKLLLSDNVLKTLVSGSFCGFPNLEELDVSKNSINSVDQLAFTKLDRLLKLSLSENRLMALPHGGLLSLNGLVMLDLSSNRLTEAVFAELVTLSTLEVLRLSGNVIRTVKDSSIDGLWSLKELYLGSNSIVHLENPFGQLRSLTTLVLSLNTISDISKSTFAPLVNLAVLDLGNNDIGELSAAHFAANAQLAHLDVTSNNLSSVPDLALVSSLRKLVLSQNPITAITLQDGRVICDMGQLEELHMDVCAIANIADGAFDCGLNLTVLNLNSNSIASVRGAFADDVRIEQLLLARNHIEELWMDDIPKDVVEVDLSDNRMATLRSPLKQRLRNMSLLRLNLADNLLTDLSDVHLPSSLKHLFLSGNKMQLLELGNFELANNSTCFALEKLKMLSVTGNELHSVCPLIFYLAASQTFPDLDLNENPLHCDCEIAFLIKYEAVVRSGGLGPSLPSSGACPSWQQGPGNNHLSSAISHDRFVCQASGDFCDCNTNSLYSTMCNFPCPQRCLCYLSSDYKFQFINCTAAGLDAFPPLATQLPLELRLTNNSLKAITAAMLRSYSRAVALRLDDNRIASVDSGAFQGLSHLRLLNLETNLLKSLPDGAFDNLSELAELYLAHNRLMHLTARVFQPLQAVRVIQLHDNNLSNFSVWNWDAPPSLVRLSLRDNPWSCDCRYVEQFRHWLQNYSSVVEDVTQLFCTADNGTVQSSPLISFNSSQCYVLKDEVLVANVALWTSVLASMGLVSLMGVLTFIYRREMQVLIYYNYGVRLFYKNTEELDGDKCYDAFVAHSALDEEFLANELVPGLENIEQPYRLCIHQRDFLVGAVITESILEAVEKSRRTIVLLSENFVRSEWCRFEFKSAHLKTLADRCNRLIVIVLGKLPPDLDPEMKLYMKTNTYLDWGDRLFWQKLYFALPDRKPVE